MSSNFLTLWTCDLATGELLGFAHRRYVLVSTGLGKMNIDSISVSKHDVIYPVSNQEQLDMRVQKRCRKISLLKVFEASEEPATAFTLNTASGTAVRN